ncbi:MAG: hypothetical protein IJK19_06230 [Bacteroidales bacterium]|nr:hypothetical protein [Bacteroidales bacterium]
MAKSDIKKQRSSNIEIVWKENVPQATYYNRAGYSIVAKVENGQFILTRDGWDDDPKNAEGVIVSPMHTARLKDSFNVKHSDTLLKAIGRRFAQNEPHKAYARILTSLDRRGIPYQKVKSEI